MAKKYSYKKPSTLSAYKGVRKSMPKPTKVRPGKRGKGVNYARSVRSGKRRGW